MEKRIDLKELLNEAGVRMSRLMHYGTGEEIFPETGEEKWSMLRNDCTDAALDVSMLFEAWLDIRLEKDEAGMATGIVVIDNKILQEKVFTLISADLQRMMSLRIERTLLQGRLPLRERELLEQEETITHGILCILL